MKIERLRKQMEEYLISGFGIPVGLKEQWLELTNKPFKPSFTATLMYRIIKGTPYEKEN